MLLTRIAVVVRLFAHVSRRFVTCMLFAVIRYCYYNAKVCKQQKQFFSHTLVTSAAKTNSVAPTGRTHKYAKHLQSREF